MHVREELCDCVIVFICACWGGAYVDACGSGWSLIGEEG